MGGEWERKHTENGTFSRCSRVPHGTHTMMHTTHTTSRLPLSMRIKLNSSETL